MAHKLLRGPSSRLCSKMFCQRQERPYSATQNGQHNSSGLCEQARRDNVPTTQQNSQRPVALVSTQRYFLGSRAQGISSDDRPAGPHKIHQIWGALDLDMFASRLTTQMYRFHSWRPDPETEFKDGMPSPRIGAICRAEDMSIHHGTWSAGC